MKKLNFSVLSEQARVLDRKLTFADGKSIKPPAPLGRSTANSCIIQYGVISDKSLDHWKIPASRLKSPTLHKLNILTPNWDLPSNHVPCLIEAPVQLCGSGNAHIPSHGRIPWLLLINKTPTTALNPLIAQHRRALECSLPTGAVSGDLGRQIRCHLIIAAISSETRTLPAYYLITPLECVPSSNLIADK